MHCILSPIAHITVPLFPGRQWKHALLILLITLFPAIDSLRAEAAGVPAMVDLRTEGVVQPMGVEEAAPRFSWRHEAGASAPSGLRLGDGALSQRLAGDRKGDYSICVPPNARALFKLPLFGKKGATVSESGKVIWQNGKPMNRIQGIGAPSEKNERLEFHVGSGTYQFEVFKP